MTKPTGPDHIDYPLTPCPKVMSRITTLLPSINDTEGCLKLFADDAKNDMDNAAMVLAQLQPDAPDELLRQCLITTITSPEDIRTPEYSPLLRHESDETRNIAHHLHLMLQDNNFGALFHKCSGKTRQIVMASAIWSYHTYMLPNLDNAAQLPPAQKQKIKNFVTAHARSYMAVKQKNPLCPLEQAIIKGLQTLDQKGQFYIKEVRQALRLLQQAEAKASVLSPQAREKQKKLAGKLKQHKPRKPSR